MLALLAAQALASSSSEGGEDYHGVNTPGPGDVGYAWAPRGGILLGTGVALSCPQPDKTAGQAVDDSVRTAFERIFTDIVESDDVNGEMLCLDVVCAVAPGDSDTVMVVLDLGVKHDADSGDDGWTRHEDRRRLAACAGSITEPDSGWTNHEDRRLAAAKDELCVEETDGGWERHEDRRRLHTIVCIDAADDAPEQADEGSCLEAAETLLRYKKATEAAVESGAFQTAFEKNMKVFSDLIDGEVSGPGDVGYPLLVMGECTVDRPTTLSMVASTTASIDDTAGDEDPGDGGPGDPPDGGPRDKPGDGGGSKKKKSSGDDMIIGGVIIALACLLIAACVIYFGACRGRSSSRGSTSSACASKSSSVAEPTKLEPVEDGMMRSFEMASSRTAEERKEEMAYAQKNPVHIPVV